MYMKFFNILKTLKFILIFNFKFLTFNYIYISILRGILTIEATTSLALSGAVDMGQQSVKWVVGNDSATLTQARKWQHPWIVNQT